MLFVVDFEFFCSVIVVSHVCHEAHTILLIRRCSRSLHVSGDFARGFDFQGAAFYLQAQYVWTRLSKITDFDSDSL